ncbi:MAG: hypothetical protein DBX47_06795 [Clostridiales bacterium]|nr:MAG: hypothetical protein DBX47_06795 [Clostridiales bacterium]
MFDDILAFCRQSNNKKAVEIGAGTGKATSPFLDKGLDVTAIDISENMSAFLKKRFSGNEKFNVITSTFEDVKLSNDSYDLIYAASAFHWVDAEIGCPKAFDLLKKDGVIALFRYNIIAKVGDTVFEQMQKAYEKYYYSFYTSNNRPIKKTKKDLIKPSEIFISFRFEDLKIMVLTR